MAGFAVGSAAAVQLVGTVTAQTGVQRRVRNDGPSAVLLSKSPLETASDAADFSVAASAEETVFLAEGERLFGICAAGQSATVEVI